MHRIVHSCSNAHVAHAAVASIGGDFAAEFLAEASRRNMFAGALAATMVKQFSITAAAEDLGGLADAARGSDQPILSGLRYILSHPALAR